MSRPHLHLVSKFPHHRKTKCQLIVSGHSSTRDRHYKSFDRTPYFPILSIFLWLFHLASFDRKSKTYTCTGQRFVPHIRRDSKGKYDRDRSPSLILRLHRFVSFQSVLILHRPIGGYFANSLLHCESTLGLEQDYMRDKNDRFDILRHKTYKK